jgi:hypothetical protein
LFLFNVVPLSPAFEGRQRERWGLDGNWARWTHRTMDSDEARRQLRRFAAASTNTVFNYLDPAGRLEKREAAQLMRVRDDVARAVLSAGANGAATAEAWQRLESAVRSHFPA